jgi:hypothetical protein
VVHSFDALRSSRIVRREWPLLCSAGVVASGMAYGLLWAPVVRHQNQWIDPGDIWGAYRSAHFIAWGAFGSVYAAGTRLITFPGILLLFAPVAMLTGGLGMSESFPFALPHPTAWLVLGPYEMLIGCVALFACDALAERLGVGSTRRIALCLAEAVALWPVLVLWGHPEDALAVALVVYASARALDDRWTGAGWLFGAAIATQPLVISALPVLLACAGIARAAKLLIRSFAPSVLLLATPVLASFPTTMHALVDQPNFPRIDHPTPWLFLAPSLGGSGSATAVAAGPGRVVGLLAACVLGLWIRRWRQRPDLVVWALAVALAMRCFTESVMDPYYVWPCLALGLVSAASRPRRFWVLAALIAVVLTVGSEFRFGEWVWWLTVTAAIALFLAVGHQTRMSRVGPPLPIDLHAPKPEADDDRSGVLVGAT